MQAAEERVEALEERREALAAELEAAYSGDGDESGALALAAELKRVQGEIPEALRSWEELAERLEQDGEADAPTA